MSAVMFGGLTTLAVLLASVTLPASASAAWVRFDASGAPQFQVAGLLSPPVVPNASGSFTSPSCGSQGGTSLALVSGRKLLNVDPVEHPVVLVISCLDNGNATVRARLNFIDPTSGAVIRQFQTSLVPANGWAHLVHRPDKGDLLGCGNDGKVYTIDFSKTNSIEDGTATQVTPQLTTSCNGLTWDPDTDLIYQGLSVSGGSRIGRVVAYKQGATGFASDFTNLPCPANGMTISGGTLMLTCEGTLTIHRLDKANGAPLGVHATLTATGLPTVNPEPGLGDLACDPVSFHRDITKKDTFTDAMWSRRGPNGNAIVALEFPASTCSMPSQSITRVGTVPFSPLAAGLSAPGPNSGPQGMIPRKECFDASGMVRDADNDGLPDCWEPAGIDFNGDGPLDLAPLCVRVDTNGDGIPDADGCANPGIKDLFVHVDYMQHHKPDPQALSQPTSPGTLVNGVPFGVRSVREAFLAAPLANVAGNVPGVRLHIQVADQPVTINLASGPVSHVDRVALTPCTGPAGIGPTGLDADFDQIKADNFGPANQGPNVRNAKLLVFRYVLFAHTLVGNTDGTCNGSGAAEVGGDDAVVSLGTMVETIVNEGGTLVTHRRGTRDQQAGTFMHELGHLLGLEHGGFETVNCKPNYLSVMNYPRQFNGSPISNRRLDYSRAALPTLNEASLNEALGLDFTTNAAALGPILPYFPVADPTVFGPSAWSLTATTGAINWDRDRRGDETGSSANINQGPTSGCDGVGTILEGHDDWDNLIFRLTAAVDAAGGTRTEMPNEMTAEDEEKFFRAADDDANEVGDNVDCGGFTCEHRIDIKPSFPFPKTIKLGAEATVTVAIFSEPGQAPGQTWSAPKQVVIDDLTTYPLRLTIDYFTTDVKVNRWGQGTCSESDVEDPVTLRKDGLKDFKCQFPMGSPAGPPPLGTNYGIVSGYFRFVKEDGTVEVRAFRARQPVTILP